MTIRFSRGGRALGGRGRSLLVAGALTTFLDLSEPGGSASLAPTERNLLGLPIDIVGTGRQAILDLLRFAARTGLPLTAQLEQAAHATVLQILDEALDLRAQVNNLGPGDSVRFSGNLGLGAGLDLTIAPEVEIFREEDGQYRVTVGNDTGVGEGAGAAIHGLGGGKAEYKFASSGAAHEGALLLASANAAPALPLLDSVLDLLPSELQFLRDNLSSVQIRSGVSAEVDEKFASGDLGFGAEASVQLTTGYKLEFEQGNPKNLVRVTEAVANASVEATVGLFAALGPRTSGDPIFFGTGLAGEVKGTLSVESRIPIDDTEVTDLALFVLNPIIAPFAGPAVTTLKGELVLDAGLVGARGSFEVGDLEGTELQQVVERLVDGDFSHALEDVDVATQGRWGTLVDQEFKLGFDNKTGGAGVEAQLSRLHRDYTLKGTYGD